MAMKRFVSVTDLVFVILRSNKSITSICKLEMDTLGETHLTYKTANSMKSKSYRWTKLNWISLTTVWTGLLCRWLGALRSQTQSC